SHVYLVGGYEPTTPANDMQIYNPAVACGTVTATATAVANTATATATSPASTATRTATVVSITATATCPAGGGTLGPWTFVANYPMTLESAAIATDGTYVYGVGGANNAVATNLVERYDPVANTWTALATLPAALYDAHATYAGNTGKLYVFGGYNSGSALDTTYIYDPGANTWTTGAVMPAARVFPGVAYYAATGKIYAVGGFDSSFAELTNTWEYDPVANTWNTSRAPIPVGMGGSATSIVGQFIYLMGSYGGSATTLHYRYDIVANTWTTRAALPAARYDASAGAYGGKIYLFGGGNPALNSPARSGGVRKTDAPAAFNTTFVYDVASDSWSTGPNMNTTRSFSGGTAIGNRLLAVVGFDGSADTNTVETAVISTACGTATATPPPVNTATATNTAIPSATRTSTVVPSATATNTAVPSATNTAIPSATNTTVPSTTNTAVPSATRTAVPSTTNTPVATSTNTAVPNTATRTATVPPGSTATATTPPANTATPTTPPNTATPTATACTNPFSDVHQSDYFYTPVLYLYCHGVVSGYSDGTFRPYAYTTRSQMVKIVVLGFQKAITTPAGGAHTFADVLPGNNFFNVIETAAAHHIVSGYDCGGPGEPCDSLNRPYFRPYDYVTRGQLAKIDVIGAGWTLYNPVQQTFSDVPRQSTFYEVIETAHCHGVVDGYSDGTFRPYTNATRGQISKIVYLSIINPPMNCGPAPTATP
ncbi:MAG: Kelch repeat-containing protein, partial [Chloroflexia bacterium]